jgi:D-lactate dehydrogenase
MTELITSLRAIVGHRWVLTRASETARFRTGYRCGSGEALAVVRPGTLVEQWRVLQACIAANVSIIVQAANTGLTGGSTPDGRDYPGGVVIISTTRISGVHLLGGGEQVVCLAGTTLYELERALKPLGREPHSVIGSSCIGASVIGGVCNNSGGSLIRRGPSFTELALYAQLGSDGQLRLINHLDIALGDEPEEILHRLEDGRFDPADIVWDAARKAHDHDYEHEVRQVESDRPARFNADPRCLFEAAGSAGKLMVFAVRLSTFAGTPDTTTFYIGTNDTARLTAIRRRMLAENESLPISAEYMHRACFDITAEYGKDTVLAIELLGTDRLPLLFALKARIDALAAKLKLGANLSDRLLQALSRLAPDHLPPRMRGYRDAYEHHLILKLDKADAGWARAILDDELGDAGGFFECTAAEAKKAFLHRFAAAGAAVRYRAIHGDTVEDIMALDIALPRNDRDWFESLPPEIEEKILHKLYYGHFFCHVFHQDYVVRKGCDPLALEHAMWALLDARGAEYPAEHNVGHLYKAKPALAAFYRALDPANRFNPGIGQTMRARDWGTAAEAVSSR